MRAECASEVEKLADKLSAATHRGNAMEALAADAVDDVIVARMERAGKPGIVLPARSTRATVHQELYYAHKARMRELQEHRDRLKVISERMSVYIKVGRGCECEYQGR